MIKRKKKICKGCHHEKYLFGNGLCDYCYKKAQIRSKGAPNKPIQRRSPLKGSKVPLEGKSRSMALNIKPRSEKRADQEKEYKKIKREMLKKKQPCFFCGKEIKDKPDIHHLKGREGSLLIDKKYLVVVHRRCHTTYHDMSIEKWPWKEEFLERVREVSEEIYLRIIWRCDK